MKRKKMKTHKLARARLLKAIQGHRPGQIILRRSEHIDKLVKMGIAEAIDVQREPIKKEEKTPVETKEEKFAPAETKDFSHISLKQLREKIITLPDETLLAIIKDDYRKGAVSMAEEEIRRREGK